MRKLKNLSFLLGLAMLMMSCATVKNATEVEELSTAIKGEWKIEYEECCGRTSSTTYGGSSSIRFNVKKSTYTIYDGDVEKENGTYSIFKGERGAMINLGEKHPAFLYIEDGKLHIDRGYMDLDKKVYTK